ncbi:MAG: transposase [Algoriphagus sp.]|nr:transposase [Algoriphagus sp.]
MNHSHSNIWTHLVLWTKDHQRVISYDMNQSFKEALDLVLFENSDQQLHFSILHDHIHLLIKLPGNMSVDRLVKHLQDHICQRLEQNGFRPCIEWDEHYHAHSVSLNRLSAEKNLLERQEYKHKEISLFEELKFLGM